MKIFHKIAIIGGTGKSGKYLVQELLKQGFYFKILVRNPDNFKIQSPFMEVIPGDVTDYNAVKTLLDGCHSVISTLGMGIPNSAPDIFSRAAVNVLRAMKEFKLRRYIVITGLNVDVPHDHKNPKVVFATDWMKQHYPVSTADKQTEYEILSESDVDWTLVMLPMIEQTEDSSIVNVNLRDCSGDKISATDLALFLIEQLSDETYLRKCSFIANI